MGSYIPSTRQERQEMLSAIGMSSTDELYAAVPESVRLKELNIPEGCTELEVREKITGMAGKNKVFDSIFRGAGAYHHYIPSIVRLLPPRRNSSPPILRIRRKSARGYVSPSLSIRRRCAS